MKKILSLLLVVAMVFAIVACDGLGDTTTTAGTTTAGTTGTQATTGSTVEVNPGFDEDDVVFTFGAISDIHLEKNSSYGTEQKFVNALNQLLAFTDERGGFLNAVAIVGDVCETKEQISTFKTLYESLNMPGELIFGLGNHDQEATYSNQALTLQDFKDVLGDKYFGNEYNDLAAGNRYFEIDGQHFIYVQPESYKNAQGNRVTFSASTISWLDGKLNEITTANPNAYVYVLVHAMIYDTCYGSTLTYAGGADANSSYWFTTDLTDTLSKYPQVMTFSGHLHFPINDERSIMQTAFTSIGTGSVAYLAIEDGYSNTATATTPADAGATSAGHVVEIDSKGNVRVTRLNFSNGTQMGSWVLTAPTADGAHLKAYGKDRADTNQAPSMAGATAEVALVQIGGSGYGANLAFTAGTDDSFVHHYKVKFTNTTDNTVVKEVKLLTDFWVNTNPADMAKSYSYGLGSVISGKSYKVEVIAVDSWGAESAAVTATFEVSATFDGTINATDVLVDVEFNADGTATDSKGNATVTLVGGATVESKDVTHGGITKPLAGLQVAAKGQSGTITFTNYDLEAMKGLYNGAKGFSLEAFYINRVKSGTQGIICATEFGGLGMADSNSGVPGLCSYYASGKYDYTRGSTVASATELVHVITTSVIYDGNLYTSVYVNGELTQSKSIASTGYWMTDSRYASYANQLSLGNDIGPNGFPTSDFTMVDAKVYSIALNPEQVKTAYNAAKALFN